MFKKKQNLPTVAEPVVAEHAEDDIYYEESLPGHPQEDVYYEESSSEQQEDVYYEETPSEQQEDVYYEETPSGEQQGEIYYNEDNPAGQQQGNYRLPDYVNNPIQQPLDHQHQSNGHMNRHSANDDDSDDFDDDEPDYKNIMDEQGNYVNWVSQDDEVAEEDDDPDYVNNPANFDSDEDDYLKVLNPSEDVFPPDAHGPVPSSRSQTATTLPPSFRFPDAGQFETAEVAPTRRVPPPPPEAEGAPTRRLPPPPTETNRPNSFEGTPTRRVPPPPTQTNRHNSSEGAPTRRLPPPPTETNNSTEGAPGKRVPPLMPQKTTKDNVDDRQNNLGQAENVENYTRYQPLQAGEGNVPECTSSDTRRTGSQGDRRPSDEAGGRRPSDNVLSDAKSENIPTVKDMIASLNKSPAAGVGKPPPGAAAICVFPGMKSTPQPRTQPPVAPAHHSRPVPAPRPGQGTREPPAVTQRKVPDPPAVTPSMENVRSLDRTPISYYPQDTYYPKDKKKGRAASEDKPAPPPLASMPRRASLPGPRPLPETPREPAHKPLPETPREPAHKPMAKAKPQSPNKKTKDNLHGCAWYQGRINRQEAEHKLLNLNKDGGFLVRPSRDGPDAPNAYALSVYYKKRVWHFHVRRRSDKKIALGKKKKVPTATLR